MSITNNTVYSKPNGLLVYHSGAGSTDTIARIIAEKTKMDVFAINFSRQSPDLNTYDFLVFGFPTYHSEPSISMQDYIRKLDCFTEPKHVYAFTTCGLFSENAMRVFYDLCESKNITLCGFASFRAPATDGILIFPNCKWLMSYEKDVAARLKHTLEEIGDLKTGTLTKITRPTLKWYTIFNYLNKQLGKRYKHNFYVSEKCVGCGQCVKQCIRKCILINNGVVEIDHVNCEFCFKCIHHCPTSAIRISKKRKTRKRLDSVFYRKLEQKIRMELDRLY